MPARWERAGYCGCSGENLDCVDVKARVKADFHLSVDGTHVLASAADVSPPVVLRAGDLVEVTDGELTRLAVVDSVQDATLSLVVRWDPHRPTDVATVLRGAHAGPGPSAEQARAAERAGDEETAARRLAALGAILAEYEAAHGTVTAEEMERAVQRLRARGGRAGRGEAADGE